MGLFARIGRSKLLALLVALVGVLGYAGWRELHHGWRLEDIRLALETEASFRLGRQVRVGAISGDLWHGIELGDVAISKTRWGFGHGTFAEARRVVLRYRGRAMLRGLISPLQGIDRVELDGLRTEVIRDASGRWNFEDLLPKPDKPSRDRFSGTVVLRDATIRYRDALAVTRRGAVDVEPAGLNVEASFRNPARIELTGSCAGGTVPVRTIAFRASVSPKAQAASADLDLVGADLPYAISSLPISPSDLVVDRGEANASAHLAWCEGEPLQYAVRAYITNGEARLPQLLRRPFGYEGYLDASPERLVAEDAHVRYGTSHARISGNLLGLGRLGGLLYDARVDDAELVLDELFSEWPTIPEAWRLDPAEMLRGDFHVTGSSDEVLLDATAGLPSLTVRGPSGLVLHSSATAAHAGVSGLRRASVDAALQPARLELSTPPLFEAPTWLRTRDTGLTLAGELRLRLGFSDSTVHAVATLRKGTGWFLDAPLEDVSADMRWDGDRILVSRVSGWAAGARLDGHATVTLTGGHPVVAAEGSIRDLDLATLGRWIDMGEDPLAGQATARVSYLAVPGQAGTPLTVRGRVDGLGWRELALESTSFAARIQDGVVHVPYFQVSDAKGIGHGAFRLLPAARQGDPPVLRDGRFASDDVDLAQVLAALEPEDAEWPPAGGRAAFAVNLSGPISAPAINGKLQVLGPSYDRWSADSLLTHVAWDGQELVLSDAQVRRRAATLSGTGIVRGLGAGKDARPEVDLTAHVERLSVADVYELAGQDDPKDLTGLLYGEIDAEGPLDNLHGGGRLTLRDGSYLDWPIREASVDAELGGPDLVVRAARVRLDEGSAEANGTVRDWLGSRFLELSWKTDGLRIDPERQRWARAYGLGGNASAEGTISGPIEDFEARGELLAHDVMLGGQPFRVANARFRATRYSGAGLVLVDFGPARLEGAGGLISATGFWESGAQELNLSVDAAGLRFTSLASLLQAVAGDPSATAPIVRAAETIGGDLYGHVSIEGKPGGLYVALDSARLEGGHYRGKAVPEVSASAWWDQARARTELREFAVALGSGLVSGSLRADLGEGGRLDGAITGAEVPLPELAAFFGTDRVVRQGTGQLQLVVSGETTRPTIEGSASARDLDIRIAQEKPSAPSATRTLKLPRAQASGIRVSEGAIEVARLELGSGDALRDLAVTGVLLPFSWEPLGLVRDEPVHAHLTLPNQQLAELPLASDLAKRYRIAGRIGADVTLTGTLDHPQFEGQAALTDGTARIVPSDELARKLLGRGALEATRVGLRVTLSPGQGDELSRIAVSDLRASLLGGQIRGGGSIRLADLALLDPRNQFDLRLVAQGMTHRFFAGPDGVATLDRATVEFSYDPVARANKATLRDLTAHLGTGTAMAHGSVVLDPKRPFSEIGRSLWDAECRVTNVPVNAREIAGYVLRVFGPDGASNEMLDVGKGLLSGNLALQSPGSTPGLPSVLTGDVTLHDATLKVPLALSGGGAAPLWTMDRDDIELDVSLRAGQNVSLPQLRAPLSGSALLTGNIHDPTVQGEFRGDGGQIGILGRTWELQHLGLRFNYSVESDTRALVSTANLDIQAETKVSYHGQYVRIVLRVQGPLGTSEMHLTSDPSLPQEEIIRLIAPGGGGGDESAGGGGGGLSGTLDSLQKDLGGALEGLVTTKAIEGLLDQLRKALGLKKLSLDIQEGARIRGFDVEAEISPNLFLRVREGMNATEKRQEVLIGFGYRLPGKTTVQLEVTNLGEVRGTFEGQWRF